MRGRKRNYVIVGSDNKNLIDDEQEVNDYEVLDEEVLSVSLGVNENMSDS
jgi:hypothetical protein